MKKYIIGCLALCLIMVMGCQKEESFEVGNNPSEGSLLSEITGDCLPKTVNGTYVAADPLVPAINTITVSVNVTKTGTYIVSTDTVNGYFFRATGVFVKLGTNTVTLRSNGTPFSAGVNNFVVSYDSTFCDIAITVLPVGTKPAAYTLETTAGNCSGAVVGGSYAITNPLNFTNTVKISVNVTTIGTYTISTTTTNGMTFSGTGSFTTTGVQLVTLAGTGTPVTNGNTTIPLTVGTITCNFVVPVGNPAIGTFGTTGAACTPANVSGTYTAGTALVSTTNTVQVQVNVTTAGVFSITTNTVDGIAFAASGSFSTPTTTLVTLNGTGTPTSGGLKVFTVTFGTSTCTFSVPVNAPAAVFSANCATATPNGIYQAGTALTASNTITLPVTVITAGTYNVTTTLTNGMTFTGTGSLTLASTSITLTGSGTPATATTSNIPAPGTTACNIPITVVAAGSPAAVFSANCATATPNGIYQAGTALTASNTITLPVTVTTAGTYNVSTTLTNGMTFTGSGSLTLASTSITLTGSGTPATAIVSNIPAPGTAACNIPITVTAAAVIDWKFNIGATVYQGQSSLPDITYITTAPPFSILDYLGDNVAGDECSFTLIDLAAGVTATEQYASTSTGTINAVAFYFIDAGNTIDLVAQPADPGPPATPAIGNMVFNVTSHNTTTKTVVGTFSGTAFDFVSNTTKTITTGTFTAKYL